MNRSYIGDTDVVHILLCPMSAEKSWVRLLYIDTVSKDPP